MVGQVQPLFFISLSQSVMKRHFLIGIACLQAMLFSACHSAHNHDEHNHDEHTEETAHSDADAHGKADEHAHGSDEIAFSPEQAKAAGLRVETLKAGEFAEVVEVSGRVLPAPGAEATVSATMAGVVNFAAGELTDGTAVRNGQPLFRINASVMADGNPAAAAQAELQAARTALERAERLAKEQIISTRELEDARLRFATAQTTAQSLGGASQSRTVGAPIGGYVKNVVVKPGDYVAAGQALATVTQNNRLQLRADVPERFYALLPNLQTANFRMAYDTDNRTYALSELGGRLVSKGKSSSDTSFFVPVTFEFNNRGNIVPGSLAQVFLKGSTRQGVLAVPTEALTEAQGLYFVYLQIHPDAYRKQEVKIGATDGVRTEIISGLKAGDKVVTRGATQVRLAANATVIPEGHSH